MTRPIAAGTIVRLNTRKLGVPKDSPAFFLVMQGTGVRVLTDGGFVKAMRRQISVPTIPILSFAPMRLRLAYGVWTEQDGTKVLFSRNYFPLWRVSPGGDVVADNPWRWVHFVEQNFWYGVDEPWSKPRVAQEIEDRMQDMGVTGNPKLLDAVEILIRNPNLQIRDAVRMMVPPGEQPLPHLQ